MSRDGGLSRVPRDGRQQAPRPRGQAPAQPADASPLIVRLQRTAGNASVADLVDGMSPAAAVQQVLAGPAGAPLDAAMQARMEAAYGADFSSVRVHTGQDAATSAAALGARAYTVGEDIVLGTHAVDEQTMAHELAHVVQQREGPVDGNAGPDGLSVSDPDDRFEQAAEETAGRVAGGHAPGAQPAVGAASGGQATAQRATDDEEPEATGSAPAPAPQEGSGGIPAPAQSLPGASGGAAGSATNPIVAAMWEQAVQRPLRDGGDALEADQPDYPGAFNAAGRAREGVQTIIDTMGTGDARLPRAYYLRDDLVITQTWLAPLANVKIGTTKEQGAEKFGEMEHMAEVVGESIGGNPVPPTQVNPEIAR